MTEKKPKKTLDKKVNHSESRGAVQQEKKLDETRPKQPASRTSTHSPPKVDRSENRVRPIRAEKKVVQSVDSSLNATSTNEVEDEVEATPVPGPCETKEIPQTPSMTASSSFSWARERALEQQIESLRETLKDTQERMQSLRLQYDNVSQTQRKLRETNAQMQEDMEHLKIDSQHLRECANILRSELQAARKDRADALEMQKMLQRELDENREAKKKLSAETDASAKKILDLQRQCKEMERIVARKNPSAMSSILGKGMLAPRWIIWFLDVFCCCCRREEERLVWESEEAAAGEAHRSAGAGRERAGPKGAGDPGERAAEVQLGSIEIRDAYKWLRNAGLEVSSDS